MKQETTHTVVLTWNNATQQWRLRDLSSGKFVQEFYDCPQFLDYFPLADKSRQTLYEISIRKVGEIV